MSPASTSTSDTVSTAGIVSERLSPGHIDVLLVHVADGETRGDYWEASNFLRWRIGKRSRKRNILERAFKMKCVPHTTLPPGLKLAWEERAGKLNRPFEGGRISSSPTFFSVFPERRGNRETNAKGYPIFLVGVESFTPCISMPDHWWGFWYFPQPSPCSQYRQWQRSILQVQLPNSWCPSTASSFAKRIHSTLGQDKELFPAPHFILTAAVWLLWLHCLSLFLE